MSRTLQVDAITDTRFEGTKAKHQKLVKELCADLTTLPGVVAEATRIRPQHFTGPTDIDTCFQWRTWIYVHKTRATTWDTIYETLAIYPHCQWGFL